MKFQAGIIGCLVKILIFILVLALIVALAFVIIGNLKMSTLKFDTVKLGDTTLGELGLGDQKVKTVAKAAYKLISPNEASFKTHPFTDADGVSADDKFTSIPKSSADNRPFYFSLLTTQAEFAGDPKIALTDGEIGYILDRILSSGQENELLKISNAYRMRTVSSNVTIKEGKKFLNLTFSMDTSTITGELPKIPVLNWFYDWPTEAFLTYSAELVASLDGELTVVGSPEVGVNGLDASDSEVIFTAVGKTKAIEPAEGRNHGQAVGDALTNIIVKALNNIGQVADYGTNLGDSINRNQIIFGSEGIKEGEIWFAKR